MINKALDNLVDQFSLKRRSPFWRYTFNTTTYFNDFNFPKIKKHLLILIILLLFSEYLISTVGTEVFNFISSKINKGKIVNIIFYGFLMPATVIYFFNRIISGFVPTLNTIINTFIYTFIYIYLIRTNTEIRLYPIEYWLKFADISFSLILVSLSKWSLYFDRTIIDSKNYQFIIDKKETNDIFGYNALSRELTDFIHNTDSEHSFAIGVLGSWGDGKTFITNQIINNFKSYKDDYIVIEFNPWLYDKNLLIENFFREFLNSTSKIHKSLPSDFISYMSKITGESNNDKISIANFFIKLIHDDRSADDLKKSINKTILLSRKKVIVVIDDTDRLDQDEISQVLKIIRNSADFSNTFFIAGMDYEYICNKIGETKYLEKIFNVLTPLPKVSTTVFKQEVLTRFIENFHGDPNLEASLNELLSHNWFTYFLTNIRQLNRLINSFKIAYNKLKDHADLKDLLILETLKNSATKSYIQILKGEILHYNEMTHIATDSRADAWIIDIEDKYKDDIKLRDSLKSALTFLVKRKDPSSTRMFSNGYDLMYFNFNSENISIVDLYTIIEGDSKNIIENFNNWSKRDPQKTELINLLTLYIENNVINTYKKLIPILLELDDPNFASTIFENAYVPNDTSFALEYKTSIDYFKNVIELLYENRVKNPKKVIEWTSKIVEFIIDFEDQTTLDHKVPEVKNSFLTKNSDLLERNYIASLNLINRSNYSLERRVRLFSKCILKNKDWDSVVSEKCRIILINEIFEEIDLSELIEYIQDYFVFESLYSHTHNKMTNFNTEQLAIYNHERQSESQVLNSIWNSSYQLLNELSIWEERSGKLILYELELLISYIYYILTGLWGDVPIFSKEGNSGFDRKKQSIEKIRNREIDNLSRLISKVPEDSLIYIQLISMLTKYYLELKDYLKVVEFTDIIIKSSRFSLAPLEEIFTSDKESIIGYDLDKYPRIRNDDFIALCEKGNFMHLIRYTEILLIAAEANYFVGENEIALQYINDIRTRNKKNLIDKFGDDFNNILLEEWKENLGSEGSYFIALKRNGIATENLGIEQHKLILPIPMQVLMFNPNISQNSGYN